MQGGEFDRKPGALEDAAPVRGLADGVQRLPVGGEVALRIGLGDRRLAQHVVGVAKAFFLLRAAVGQRLGNGLPSDELLAHQPHGALHALADQRLASFADDSRQRIGQTLLAGGRREPASQHQHPDGGVDKQRGRVAEMGLPVAAPVLSRMRASRVALSGMRSSASPAPISRRARTPSTSRPASWRTAARCVASGICASSISMGRHSGSGRFQAAVMAARRSVCGNTFCAQSRNCAG